MCLAVPGKLETIEGSEPLTRRGKVSFGGVLKEVSLAYVPEAEVGDYLLVHVGFALAVVDEEEAAKIFDLLREMGEAEDGGATGDPAGPGEEAP